MKYVFQSYNYLTLCRALKYINEKFGRDNSIIIFDETLISMPSKIKEDYNVCLDVPKIKTAKKGILGYLEEISHVKKSWNLLKEVLKKIDDDITLIVFKDIHLKETTMIEKARKMCKGRIRVWLIEEGLGLYVTKNYNIRKSGIKSLLCKLTGVSSFHNTGKTHGMHPGTDKVIALRPEFLEEKYAEKKVELEKMIDVFDEKFSNYFVEAVVGKQNIQSKYDFVFLTMPLDFSSTEERRKKYDDFMTKMLSVLSKKGKTLIKSHPRDKIDYSKYSSDNVTVCSDNFNKIPYECLDQYFGCPRMLTFYSSACTTSSGKDKGIFLYKLIGMKNFGVKITDEFLRDNNIIDCESFEQLEEIL